MKVAVYGLNFAPEPTGIGRYSGEMVEWLAAKGHDVQVVTAPPYYPQWRVADGFSAWRRTQQSWKGAKLYRSPLWVPSQPTGLKRMVHLLSFALLSLPELVRVSRWRPDIVVVVAPAFVCAPAAWLTARACGAKCWLHVQDFELAAAFNLGLLKGKTAYRLASAVERWMFRRFDRVSTISKKMVEVVLNKSVPDERVVLFPNWVDVNSISPTSVVSSYRASLGIPVDAVVALYSGSLAGKQGLELLPILARRMRETAPGMMFVICGEGVFKDTLVQECHGLDNVRILPLQPAARLNELLSMADVHLMPQQDNVADLVMPSKLAGMMASGRPVLATANPHTEVAAVVAGRGRVVATGDVDAAVAALLELVESKALREQLGAAARVYAEEHLSRERILSMFEHQLERCISKERALIDSPVVGKTGQDADEPVESA